VRTIAAGRRRANRMRTLADVFAGSQIGHRLVGIRMLKPPKLSPDERPHGWQYPVGVLIILLMAAIAWFFLRHR
jgi:hypothetical protein